MWTELHIWQRVNHFPEAKQLTRKDNLKRHIQRYSNIPGKLGALFDILPVPFACFEQLLLLCMSFTLLLHAGGASARSRWFACD